MAPSSGRGAGDGAPAWWAPNNPYAFREDMADLLNENQLEVPSGNGAAGAKKQG